SPSISPVSIRSGATSRSSANRSAWSTPKLRGCSAPSSSSVARCNTEGSRERDESPSTLRTASAISSSGAAPNWMDLPALPAFGALLPTPRPCGSPLLMPPAAPPAPSAAIPAPTSVARMPERVGGTAPVPTGLVVEDACGPTPDMLPFANGADGLPPVPPLAPPEVPPTGLNGVYDLPSRALVGACPPGAGTVTRPTVRAGIAADPDEAPTRPGARSPAPDGA